MKRSRSGTGVGRHVHDAVPSRPASASNKHGGGGGGASSVPRHTLARQKKGPAPAPLVDHGAVVAGSAKPIVPASVSGKAVGGPWGPSNAPGASSGAAAGSLGQQPLKFSGSAQFRQRLVYSTLARRRLRIDEIRSDSENPGLQDFEASFLRLLDKLSNGMALEINETGTALKYNPGVLQGGVIEHDCGLSRSVGWFIEGVLPLLPFCKKPTSLTLTGITSDSVDVGVDALRAVALPFLSQFGLGGGDDGSGLTLTIMARGCAPLGGGKVRLICPSVRELKTISITDEGLVRKVRGVAYCCRVAPQTSNRLASASKPLLLTLLPDVHVFSDANKGSEAGQSPGYGVTLLAHTTSGVTYCAQACSGMAGQVTGTGGAEAAAVLKAAAAAAAAGGAGGSISSSSSSSSTEASVPLPEDLGAQCSSLLLDEIARGGCIPTFLQPLAFTFMALTSEDISRLRIGQLGPAGIATLRLLKQVFGIAFRLQAESIKPEALLAKAPPAKRAKKGGDDSDEDSDDDDDDDDSGSDSGGGQGEDDDDDDEAKGEAGARKKKSRRQRDKEGGDSYKASATLADNAYTGPAVSKDVAPARSLNSILVSCLGMGFKNTAKKVT